MLVFLLFLWSMQTLLAGTAVIAVRTASRSRLADSLKRIGRIKRLEWYDAHDRAYAAAALMYRQLGIVLFVVTTSMLLPETDPWYRQPIELLILSTAWIVFFGVTIPNAWAKYAGESFLARALPVMEGLRWISWPILAALHVVDEIVRRLAGVPKEQPDDPDDVEREILDALSHGEFSGDVSPAEKEIIRSAMTLDETFAGEIMTPRTDVFAVEASTGYEEVRRQVIAAGHSRIPVYDGDIDHVVGILYAKDLLAVDGPENFCVRKLMRPVTFVPETKDVASCLREFQAERVHIAIVLDEYGGTAGLITIEDILEELVGEIADEHDEPAPQPIHIVDDSTADIDARVRVEEVNEALDIHLPEDDAYDTVAGFVLARLGRIPRPGESFQEENVRVEILDARDRAISRLRIRVIPPAQEA